MLAGRERRKLTKGVPQRPPVPERAQDRNAPFNERARLSRRADQPPDGSQRAEGNRQIPWTASAPEHIDALLGHRFCGLYVAERLHRQAEVMERPAEPP